MDPKPKMTYFAGRGKGETIRLIFAANDIKFEEYDLTERAEYEKLLKNDVLLFKQLPLLEMDGLTMVQSEAICHYLARKYKMDSADTKEEFRIDQLFQGTKDFLNFFLPLGFAGDDTVVVKKARENALPRYMPVYEKILQENASGYLVGNHLTLADIGLFEILLNIEEQMAEELGKYPAIQKFFKNLKNIPSIAAYLNNVRPPPPGPEYVAMIRKILNNLEFFSSGL